MTPTRPITHVVVDGANIVGSCPDGWWRDRPGAARRLAERIVAALPGRLAAVLGLDPHVHLVLEGAAAYASGLPAHPALSVVHAEADSDSAIVAIAAQLMSDATSAGGSASAPSDATSAGGSASAPSDATSAGGSASAGGRHVVVTADRELRARVRDAGAITVGPAILLAALGDTAGR